MCKLLSVSLFLCCSLLSLSQSANPGQNTIKEIYHAIEVNDFDIQPGVDLPADYFAALPEELAKQLQESRQFESVLRTGEEPATADAPVLRLTGVVTSYKEGSRAKRYFGGFGAGSTQIFAHLKYLDRTTGQTVMEGEAVGTLSGGLFGGNSKNVVHQFATTVVTTTRLLLLKKPLPEAAEAATAQGAQRAEAPETAEPAERATLEITSGEFDAKQAALNELAAKGFHLVNYASTGNKSATLTLEKGTDPSQNRTYLLLHTKLAGNLEKDLNKAAADGYRLVPHTFAYLAGFFAIAEKPAAPAIARYQYRVHQTLRVSSAEKNIKQDQGKGFVLIDSWQYLNQSHLIVLERELELPADQRT